MNTSKELELIRASLQLKTDLNDYREKMCAEALEVLKTMPVHRVATCVQYLEKNLIPAVERKGGKTSPDLVVFKECVTLLKWAAIVHDRLQLQTQTNANLQLDLTIMRERLQLAESELQKYMVVEDLMFTDMLRTMEKSVARRMEESLKAKK